ncbi:hypothetical protein [Azospirillum soli]|uniref:hypothetical protein n=1 Tax=Azospirillum soli TaxID=1304799 RepID=UPI001AE79677|nr:hypothetical protein [Azospirillum soli]MBP2315059.1 hypothetical protein [Azospirillum soli]
MAGGAPSSRQYLFQPPEHGLQAELYLPKRADFQGVLYDTLTEAFDAANIRAYLANLHTRSHIVTLLERHWPELAHNIDAIAARLCSGIQGYTMYEVDGVYAGAGGVVSERTQIVRLMFVPGLDAMAARVTLDPDPERNRARVRDEAQILLRNYGADAAFFKARNEDALKRGAIPAELLDLCRTLEDWVEEVGLVLYGYVAGRVCLAIRDRHLRPEEEIWVTTNWGFTLNALRLGGDDGR